MKISVKYSPLSVNKAWQGKRFKTQEYLKFERDLLLLLPNLRLPDPPYRLEIEFGMSAASDIDNPVKALLDVMQKKYGFNDKFIHQLIVHKTIVKNQSDHFINFEIKRAT